MSCHSTTIILGEQPSLDFICQLCSGIAVELMKDKCGHAFGKECIRDFLLSSSQCPVSQSPISMSNLAIVPQTEQQLASVNVSCDYAPNCDWKGNLHTISEHLKSECLLKKISCSFIGCNEEPRVRSEMEQHMATCSLRVIACSDCDCRLSTEQMSTHCDVCPEKVIKCPQRCGEIGKRKEILSHLTQDCRFRTIFCPFKEFNCNFSGTFNQLKSHCEASEQMESHTMILLKAMIDWSSNIKNNPDSYLNNLTSIENELKEKRQKAETDEEVRNELLSQDYSVKIYQEVKIVAKETEEASKKIEKDYQKLLEIKQRFTEILANPTDDTPVCDDTELPVQAESLKDKLTGIVKKQFDSSSHGFNIHLTSPKSVKNQSDGNLILSESTIHKESLFTVTITSSNINRIAIGVCSRANAQSSFLHKSKKDSKGLYLMFGDGFYLLDGKSDCQLKEGEEPKFKFESGDKLEVSYDVFSQRLAYKNLTTKRGVYVQMQIDEDIADQFFCIALTPDSKATIYEEKKHADKAKARFSSELKGSLIQFLGPQEVTFVDNSTVACLDVRLLANQIYKFQITKKNSGFYGLGVAYKPTLVSKGFTANEHTKPSMWMFYANGLKLESGDYVSTGEGSRLTFKTGDTVYLWYDPNFKKLICKNVKTGISNGLDLSAIQDWENIYPCVEMRGNEDEVLIC